MDLYKVKVLILHGRLIAPPHSSRGLHLFTVSLWGCISTTEVPWPGGLSGLLFSGFFPRGWRFGCPVWSRQRLTILRGSECLLGWMYLLAFCFDAVNNCELKLHLWYQFVPCLCSWQFPIHLICFKFKRSNRMIHRNGEE